jgi:hypothetical protein
MTEPVPQPTSPVTSHEPPSPAADEEELARRNLRLGWALFGLFCLLFGGTIGVALIYLWLS